MQVVDIPSIGPDIDSTPPSSCDDKKKKLHKKNIKKSVKGA